MVKKKNLKPTKKTKASSKPAASQKKTASKSASRMASGKKSPAALKTKSSRSAPKQERKGKAAFKTKPHPAFPAQPRLTKTKTTSKTVEFSPLRDFVLIQRLQEAEKTAGGLYIPATALEKPMLGKVLSVGPGAVDKKGRKRPMDVKAGDQVLFGKYAGTEIQIDGESFLVLREADILGVSNEGV